MRIIIMDRAHDPDVGHPIYPEDVAADLLSQPIWAVAHAETSESGEDWDIEYETEGLTYAEAEAY